MAFVNELKSLYPGEIITLIEVDGTKFGALKYHFHNENLPYTNEEIVQAMNSPEGLKPKTIKWKGNEYGGRPFGISAIERSSDGTPARPQLTLSNLDSKVSSMVLQYDGMSQAKVTIWIIPAASFGNENNGAEKLVYYIDRASTYDQMQVTFDLTNPYDLEGIQIPARVVQRGCPFAQRGWYRSGKGCSYSGNKYFDADGNPVTDPSKDDCGGRPSDCELRFGKGNPLDFGGCSSASLNRR